MNFEKFKELTRLEQIFFGLPFVISGALLPFADFTFINQINLKYCLHWLWIIPAFMAARISGMAFNQLIDRHIDAENPRTKDRVLPAKRVSPKQAACVAWCALISFLFICSQLNLLCFILAPFAAFLLFIYSYMKRIHSSCHFVLGLIHFLSPFMAWIAIKGSYGFPPIFLGLAALLSITGNDIVYALQDYEFDRKKGLHSIPSRLGQVKSLQLAQCLHVLCVLSLFFLGLVAKLHWIFFFAPLLVGFILYYFHMTFGRTPKGKESLFFSSNILVSFAVLIFTFLGIVWPALL
jgi:4-hydroxybenzoate polyprenyltransferase